jgi:anaerobic C4-dicarboxylate transporter
MLISAAFGGIFLGVIEGVSLVIGRMFTPENPAMMPVSII